MQIQNWVLPTHIIEKATSLGADLAGFTPVDDLKSALSFLI
jgi:hypothetical protein